MSKNIDMEILVSAAKAAVCNSYSPYSKFAVGAAVITADGEIYSGCNVENASYGLSICAERNAIFQAIAKGGKSIDMVVNYTPTEKPVTPCGACRQVIAEFGNNGTKIVSVCDSSEVMRMSFREMLPNSFGRQDLGGD